MAKVAVEPKCQESTEFLDSFKKGEVDKIVTTLIFGNWDKNATQRIATFLELSSKVVKGRVGLVSNRDNIDECSPKELKFVEKREVHCGGFTLFIYIWEKN